MSREATRHDPATIALGRSKIAEIRTQLAERSPNIGQRGATQSPSRTLPPTAPSQPARSTVDEDTILDEEWSPEKISAEMAAGSERDHLLARVDHLEAEVAQLRSALAAVLNAAAAGLHAPSEPDATTGSATIEAQGFEQN